MFNRKQSTMTNKHFLTFFPTEPEAGELKLSKVFLNPIFPWLFWSFCALEEGRGEGGA